MSFLQGTGIAVPGGTARVEDLRRGDFVLTAQGHERPVHWIGRRTVRRDFAREHGQPVCIRAGALGPGSPCRDLVLTPHHGVIVGDLIVHAATMINNRSVHWIGTLHLPEEFSVFHIETVGHETLVANGVWVESFLEVSRPSDFDNADDRRPHRPVAPHLQEQERPRIGAARLLPVWLRDRLGLPDEDTRFGDLSHLLASLS